MPKSKNRRKKSKGKKSQTRKTASVSKSQAKGSSSKNAEVIPPIASSRKRSLREFLFDNEAEGLFRLVTFAPLFIGAWFAAGLVLDEIFPFILLTAAIICAHFTQSFRERQNVIFIKDLEKLMYGAQFGLIVVFYLLTKHPWASILAGICVLLEHARIHLQLDSPRRVILFGLALCSEMSLFAILGILSQVFRSSPEVVLEHGIIGLSPGLVLMAALVAQHSKVFLAYGWKRSYLKTKKGKEFLRPGALASLYSLALFLGPCIPLSTVPLGLFPRSFLIVILVVLSMPKAAQAFLDGRQPDLQIAVRTVVLAAGTLVLVFLAAVLAKFGFI